MERSGQWTGKSVHEDEVGDEDEQVEEAWEEEEKKVEAGCARSVSPFRV